MTQSDSPDFEFDISNLEVEDNVPSASKPGVGMSHDQDGMATANPGSVTQPADNEHSNSEADDVDDETKAAFEEAQGFDIGSLPDAYSAAPASTVDSNAGPASGADEAVPTGSVSRVEATESPERQAPPKTRQLGDDDLGADVFSEIDDDLGLQSFDDALDELLEEVDQYEMGGFEEDVSGEAGGNPGSGSDYYKLDDPDDSIFASGGVRPYRPSRSEAAEAVDAESKEANQPLPEVIPADPEPSNDDARPEPTESSKRDEATAEAEALDVDEESEAASAESGLGSGEVAEAASATAESAEDSEPLQQDAVESPRTAGDTSAAENSQQEVGTPDSSEDNPVAPDPVEDRGEAPESGEEDLDPTAEEVEEPISQANENGDGSGNSVADEDVQAEIESIDAETVSEADVEKSSPIDAEPADESESEEESSTPEQEETSNTTDAPPTADDLLRRAGGILNGDGPAAEASSLLESEDEVDDEPVDSMPSPEELIQDAQNQEQDEETETVSMPDPTGLVAEASGAKLAPENGLEMLEDDDEEFEVMPDPQALMEEARGTDTTETTSKDPSSQPGNVADRAGNLPPPPPAPVEIIDDDPLDEDPAVVEPAQTPETDIEAAIEAAEGRAAASDPFFGDSSLDGFNDSLEDADAFEDALLGEETEEEMAAIREMEDERNGKGSGRSQMGAMPRPTLLWRATHSLMIAASLMLIGGGAFCYVWKQEIAEFLVGRDLDASSLIDEIQTVGGQAIEGFHPGSHYRLRWIESEIRRVADDEIRLYADVEAELAENLYLPLPERVVEEEIGYDESELLQALRDAQANFPAAMADFPTKPWDSLYRLASPKGELVPLRVVYRITRENEHADWELAGVRVRGNKADLEWPEGRRRDEFADNAYDVDSPQFKKALKDYQDRSQEFVASVGALRQNLEAEAKSVAMENRKRRDHVLKSLSQGSFFSGIAIVGEDGEIAKDVTMVITETREQGALVRGVFQARERSNVSKHFVGSVDFVEGSEGREQGYLNVTTVALDGGPASDLAATFFQPGNSSRIRLKTDGFRVEGDLSDLSLRMTRNM